MIKYLISPTDWSIIYDFLKTEKFIHIKNEEATRTFVEGIYYVMRSGIQWRLLPEYYGHYRAVHKRYLNWVRKGIINRLFESVKKDPDLENVMIDATIIRAHACAAGYKKNGSKDEKLGRSVGGHTTKINALVDALGNPLKFHLLEGQSHDINAATILTENITDANVLADKGYDDDKYRETLRNQSCNPIIPGRKNRKIQPEYDKHTYKERHLAECFFSKIKHFRRVFSRFDKTAISYMGFVVFSSVFIWLR